MVHISNTSCNKSFALKHANLTFICLSYKHDFLDENHVKVNILYICTFEPNILFF